MNVLKQTALAYLEKATAKRGRILDVRAWNPATIFEIDLHLPETNMYKWKQVQHMKVKVANGIYRDYSPAMWDCETSTCTLIVDAGHEGAGSAWVKQLRKGDDIVYLGIGPTPHKPADAGQMYCLGDTSTIAHFLALEQLADSPGRLTGTIALQHPNHQLEFTSYFYQTSLTAIAGKEKDKCAQLLPVIAPLTDETVYVAGNNKTVVQLRKLLRQQVSFKGSIRPQGVWS